MTQDHAEAVYGVVLSGGTEDGTLTVDETATETYRATLAEGGAEPPPSVGRFGEG